MGRPAGSSRPRSSAREAFEEGFEELRNMWLRARRTIGGLLRGVLEEVMGSQNISQSLN
jgi:hypothetical protein